MKKIIILLLILVALLMGGFLALNKFAPDKTAKLLPCNLLSSDQCELNDNCNSVYEDVKCFPGAACINDFLTYKGCKKISKKIIEHFQFQKENCKQYGGVWQEQYKVSGECICQNTNEIGKDYLGYIETGGMIKFVEEKGCKSAKDLCEEEGGKWESDFKSIALIPSNKNKEKCMERGRDFSCTESEEYKFSQNTCIYKWYDSNQACFIEVYNRDTIDKPCTINDKQVTQESLFY